MLITPSEVSSVTTGCVISAGLVVLFFMRGDDVTVMGLWNRYYLADAGEGLGDGDTVG